MRRAAPAGGVLCREQPDRAVDAGGGAIRRARVRGQGRRLRNPGHHHRRHRCRRDRGGVRVGGRSRPRRRRPGADRARLDADVRPRASRRHAVSRQGCSGRLGVPAARGRRLCEPRALRVLGSARSDRAVQRAAPGGRADRRRRSRALSSRGRSAGRAGSAGGDRRALAGARISGAGGVRQRRPAPPRRSARAVVAERSRVGLDAPGDRSRGPDRSPGQHLSRWRDARRSRRTAGGSAGVRVRRGRGRRLWQRVPALAAAPGRVRRPDSEFDARRRRRARRLCRRGARRRSTDRRDAVQRLRRHRLQPAGEQRRQDPLPVGRVGADGRPHAVGRAPARGPVSQPEHRALVLSNAGAEDRRALDPRGCARV